MKWARLFQSANLITPRLFGLGVVQEIKPNKKTCFQTWMLGTSPSHLSKVQGNKEKARRISNTLSELRTQLTPQFAKSISRVWGSATKPTNAARGAGGYTIVEVLIVLAISGAILASSIGVFYGKRSATEFSQAMYDLQSKFQSYGTQASSASLPGGKTYTCSVSSVIVNGKVHPYLTAAVETTDSISNQSCIYLGKAIQIIPGATTLYTYPVLGLRTIYNGSYDTGASPSTSSQANSEPALDITGNFLLVEPYELLNGTQVVSAKFSGSSTEQDFLALYSSLQNENTSGNVINALSRNVTFGSADIQSAQLRSCIEEVSCGSASVLSTIWNLCVKSGDGTRSAQLSLKATATGISTSLNLEGCT